MPPNWVPLESNPDTLNTFTQRPVAAVTLLFPHRDFEEIRAAQNEELGKDGAQEISDNVLFIKQFVGNACGTIACMHAMANTASLTGLPGDSPLATFLAEHAGKSPHDIGRALEDADEIHESSEASAAGGQTAAPSADAPTDFHFIAFVPVDGCVYELDGRKEFPINHGSVGEDGALPSIARVIQREFVAKGGENGMYNMMALCQS